MHSKWWWYTCSSTVTEYVVVIELHNWRKDTDVQQAEKDVTSLLCIWQRTKEYVFGVQSILDSLIAITRGACVYGRKRGVLGYRSQNEVITLGREEKAEESSVGQSVALTRRYTTNDTHMLVNMGVMSVRIRWHKVLGFTSPSRCGYNQEHSSLSLFVMLYDSVTTRQICFRSNFICVCLQDVKQVLTKYVTDRCDTRALSVSK